VRVPSQRSICWRRLSALAALALVLAACGGGGGGGSGDPDPVDDVQVSGRITFDRVPVDPVTNGLDYAATRAEPARRVRVEAVGADGRVLAEASTDDTGRYAFEVAAGQSIRVRVSALMRRTGAPAWDFRVVDNTSGNLLYAMESEAVALGAPVETINLRADSGWDGAGYSGPRVAAPFAILDAAFDAALQVIEADPDVALPPLVLHWSPLNRESNQLDPASGQIGTTAYVLDDSASVPRGIYVLGDEDVDTDEYDSHVLAHEWGHYLEDLVARTDSIGGPHSLSSRLDLRLAFSEGWSNAFAGMALDDPLYVDTFGPGQSLAFAFDLEDDGGFVRGWYNESSVHSVLYDIYDDADDGIDAVNLGFTPIYETLTGAHADSVALTSIFSFATPLKAGNPSAASAIDALLERQDIVGVGMDVWGSTETNDAGVDDVLPVYTPGAIDGPPVTVCSNPQFGTNNRLSVRQFVRFDVDRTGRYRLTAVGADDSDPDLVLFRRGFLVISQGPDPGREEFLFELESGEHVLEVYEYGNVVDLDAKRTCFEVTVETA
jgi:hypothetical protein